MTITTLTPEILQTYNDFISELRRFPSKQANLIAIYNAGLRTMDTSIDEVNELVNEDQFTTLKHIHSLCFKDKEEQFIWTLKYGAMKQVIEKNTYCSLQMSDSYDDQPSCIRLYSKQNVRMEWGQEQVASYGSYIKLNRDIDLGPATVTIEAESWRDPNKMYITGRHYKHRSPLQGHKNWRTKCAEHNSWLRITKSDITGK